MTMTYRRAVIYITWVFFSTVHAIFAQESTELGYFRRLIAANPQDFEAHIRYQRVALKMDMQAQLLIEYRKWMNTYPDSGAFLYLYASVVKDKEVAASYLERAIEKMPDLYFAHMDLAQLHYQAGEYNRAIERYRKASKLKPTSARARYRLGLAYYHKGYVRQAIGEYKRSIELDSKYMDVYLNLGLTYYYVNDLDAAVETYQKALEFESGDRHLIYRNLGMAYARKGTLEQAEAAYRKALEIKPDYLDVHASLGNLAFRQGDFEAAVGAYQRALEGQQEDGMVSFMLGLSYYNREDYEESIRFLEKALELDDSKTDIYYFLGQACFRAGKEDQARETLKAYVEKEKRLAKAGMVSEARALLEEIR